MSASTFSRRLSAVTICVMILGTLTAQTPSVLEQRIQRIVDEIPPAVMVKGDPNPVTKLADRMAADARYRARADRYDQEHL